MILKFFAIPFIAFTKDRKMDFRADVFSGRFKKSIGNVGSPLGGEIRRGSNCFFARFAAKEQKQFYFCGIYCILYPSLFKRPKLMYICDKTIIIFSASCGGVQTDSNTVRRRIGFPFNAADEAGNMAADGPWLNWNI